MAIRISISNATIVQDARVLNNVTIRDDGDIAIDISDTTIGGKTVVWENLNIEAVINDLNKRAMLMDRNSREYGEVQEILQIKTWDKKTFIRCIAKHVTEFSQGVLASIIANYIS